MHAKIKLTKKQKKLVNKLKDFLNSGENKIYFVEAYTGFGKSIVFCKLAEYYAKKGKKVIISTYSNRLVYQMRETYKKFFNTDIKNEILIGKDHYYNPIYLQTPYIYSIIPEEKIKSFLKDVQENTDNYFSSFYLFEYLFSVFSLPPEQKYFIQKYAKREEYPEKEIIQSILNDNSIIFTNHAYLYSLAVLRKIDISDWIVFLDEVQHIPKILEAFIQQKFSIFRLRNYLNLFLQAIKNTPDLNIREIKALSKKINTLSKELKKIMEDFTRKDLKGEYYENISYITDFVERISYYLEKSRIYRKISEYYRENHLPYDLSRIISIILSEIDEFYMIKENLSRGKIVSMTFSDEKGYPGIECTKVTFEEAIYNFWNSVSRGAAMSGTLDRHVYEYLNVPENKSSKNILIISLPPEERDNVKIYYADRKSPQPYLHSDSSGRRELNPDWLDYVAEMIASTYEGKNTLVLTPAYREVYEIYDRLVKKINSGTNIIKAEEGALIEVKIEEFIRKGGILIGTEGYGVGIDLPAKQLEKLYICKLPYPYIKNIRFRNSRNKLKFLQMENEMITTLKQWAGRLRRRPDDKGDIYILDSRLYRKKEMFDRIFDKIGRIMKQKSGD